MINYIFTLLLQVQLSPDVPTTVPDELNIWSLMLKGGFFMIPLLLLSILSIYIFVERLLVVRKAAKEDKTFMDRIKDYIHDGEIDAALSLCKKTDTPAARLIAKGISRLGRPMNDVLVAIENAGNIEIAQLEKGFPWLATTAAGAPMIGFLGTVTGMVNAFYNMASAGNNNSFERYLRGSCYDYCRSCGGCYCPFCLQLSGCSCRWCNESARNQDNGVYGLVE